MQGKPPERTTTGLLCPTCEQPIATIKEVGARGVVFRCPSCGIEWSSTGGKSGDQHEFVAH
jgi:predicted RNA-binding Zn-ribbon protein involved in translation (DUF1610 family)